jgi:hypothetical protein
MKLIIRILLFCLVAGSAFAEAKLEIDSTVFNFGWTPGNSTIQHSFWLKATGSEDISISEIKTGCSCAMMPLESNEIAAGDSVLASFVWDTRRSHGPLFRYPRIYSNAASSPLKMDITAHIMIDPDSLRPVYARPFKFELARHAGRSIDSVSFRIINESEQDVTASIASLLPKECEISLPATIPAKGEATGYASVKPEFLDKEFETSITVGVSIADDHYITIPIRRKFYMAKRD